MSFLNNIMNKIRPDDEGEGYLDDDYSYENEDDFDYRDNRKESSKRNGAFTNKVIDGAPQGMQLITIKPSSLEDYKQIIDYLLDGRIVVLNMEGVSSQLAQRIIDFTYGGVYAIDGNFQGINSYIFVATPMNVDVSGDYVKDAVSGAAGASAPKYQAYNGFRYND